MVGIGDDGELCVFVFCFEPFVAPSDGIGGRL